MNSLDLQVVRQAREWISQGKDIWLCTVLSTFGSAPRSPGAMLVALNSVEHRGSLSGGCVEEDLLERLGSGHFKEVNQVIVYGDGGLAPNLALPCGGVIRVLLERLGTGERSMAHLAEMENALLGDGLRVRAVTLDHTHCAISPREFPQPRIVETERQVCIRIGAVHRLLLAGLSPVAEFCAAFAIAMGFEVVLCEPRDEVLMGFAMPGVTVHAVLPAVFIEKNGCHGATAVVALTHDPRMDDLTLLEALRTEAFYIGAMGSDRTSIKRLERLSRIGQVPANELEKIHAPIGLRLGSKTPAEIALAVMADILRVSNKINRAAL